MSRPMPTDNIFLMGNGAPINLEADSPELTVIGEVPRDLSGAYYRNGANPQYAPRGAYHLFDGDGMIHAFFFEDGRVSYKNRWIRTERFLMERAAGEALWGSMIDPSSSDPSVVGKSSNAANTSVVWHGGKLLALWEAGLPTELDPLTLDTKGLWDFDGKLTRKYDPEIAKQVMLEAVEEGPGIMTAHPKFDPVSGSMLIFGYSPTPPYLLYHEISADGRMTRTEEIETPYPAMMHDFAVTAEHILFPIFPAVFDFDEMAAGTGILGWKPELGTKIGVMPRSGGPGDIQWFDSDPCYVFHFANAETRDGRIGVEFSRFPSLPMFGGAGGAPSFWRWSIDLAGGGVKEEQIDDIATDFPRIDERFTGLAHRYSWGPCVKPGGSSPLAFDALVQYDATTGERRFHEPREGSQVGEPVFVPRPGSSEEGDGYVLVLVYRADEKRSDLLILDARQIEAEPIATLQIPVRVPSGFHGNWRQA